MTAYPLALPQAHKMAAITIRATFPVAVSRSPFTGKRQVYLYDNDPWKAVIDLVPMRRPDYEEWNGFFMSLVGPLGTFLMGDPLGKTPRGSAATAPGAPLVKGANQSGSSLVFDGAPANAATYLKTGDYFQIGTGAAARLYKTTGNTAIDGTGTGTLSFWPRLRSIPADNDPIVVANTVGLWTMTDTFSDWKMGKGGLSQARTVNVEEPL